MPRHGRFLPAFFFAAATILSTDSFAQNREALGSRLQGISHFDIEILPTPSENSQCDITESQARSILINRLVPAGIIIRHADINYFSLKYIGIGLNHLDLCLTHLDLTFYRVEQIVDSGNQAINVAVPYWTNNAIFTRGFARQRRGFEETLTSQIDLFLSRWREINAGRDFVRQQPPAMPQPVGTPEGPNIRTVQQRLQALSLYTGAIDGLAGTGTRQAIQAFQRTQQLPATGDLDRDTMRRLFP